MICLCHRLYKMFFRPRSIASSHKLLVTGIVFLLVALMTFAWALWLIGDLPSAMSTAHQVQYLRTTLLFLLALTLLAALIFALLSFKLVLVPLRQIRQALAALRRGELGTRLSITDGGDEFGHLMADFNQMARTLQEAQGDMERMVQAKTASAREQNRHLSALYAVSAMITEAGNLQELTQRFVKKIREVAACDGVAIRWSDEDNKNYSLLATEGLPEAMVEHERHLPAGACVCCQAREQARLRVVSLPNMQVTLPFCHQVGYRTVVSIPAQWQQRLLGEVTLFYHQQTVLPDATRDLLEGMVNHLASAMESMNLAALEREAAVSSERRLIAQELHDSIAQSLSFLKIQAHLLRHAVEKEDVAGRDRSLAELDTGIQECLADVRELLLHFRTRTQDEDIEDALRSTLSKFEHQTGIRTQLDLQGWGVPLAPDVQIQLLHMVQEALSNVRKHAEASKVELRVQRQPHWRLQVRDNGRGFDAHAVPENSVHVGLDIMRERAQRINAKLSLTSSPGEGTCVVIELPEASVRQMKSSFHKKAAAA